MRLRVRECVCVCVCGCVRVAGASVKCMCMYNQLCELYLPLPLAPSLLPTTSSSSIMPLFFHRQRALKELNERLNRMDNPTSPWPALEDGLSDAEPATTPTGGVAGKEGGGSVALEMEADSPASRLVGEESSASGTVHAV